MPPGEAATLGHSDAGAVSGPAHGMAFVNDAATEAALQQGLAEMQGTLEIRRGGIQAAVTVLQRLATPHVLIVDVSGEDAPLAALETLSSVVEPHVCVLVIGDLSGLDFYREVTRGIGVAEYLAKPLSREMVARHFGPLARGRSSTGSREAAFGGRLITVSGVRGGAGATTVAVNLAWHFGINARRHTVLVDPDMHFGNASFLLNVEPGHGLRDALQSPDRIDALLAERAAQPVEDRLHVLAAQDKLDAAPGYADGGVEKLLAALRRRYNFIVADVPFRPMPLYRDLLNLAHRRVLVLEPTLVAARDALRLIELPAAASEASSPVLLLNRLGRPGGLNRSQMEDALQFKVDIVIPDLPKAMGEAATFGKPAVTTVTAFRAGIVELSRQVAFTRLLDTKGYWSKQGRSKKGIFGRLLKGKK